MPPTMSQLGQPGTGNGEQYSIAFYELQNTLDVKRAALMNDARGPKDPYTSITIKRPEGTLETLTPTLPLPEDAFKVVYIKVKWVKEEDYNNWLRYSTGISEDKVKEVLEVFKPIYSTDTIMDSKGNKLEVQRIVGTEKKWALKPMDNDYTIISQEWEKNEKNRKWNKSHESDIASGKRQPRKLEDIDTTTWWIDWGDVPTETPIVYDLFNNLDAMRLIEYAQGSVSTQELLCFSKEDADFWKVPVMGSFDNYNNLPRKKGHKTKLKLKHIGTVSTLTSEFNFGDDMGYTVAGAMGYSIWPITEKQENPTMSDVGLALKDTMLNYKGGSPGVDYE
jgi:hypothetical protein